MHNYNYDNAGGGYNHALRMSNRAVDAYENGEKPLYKWTKAELDKAIKGQELEEDIIEAFISLPLKAKKTLLHETSYHHTGVNYKKTYFYSLNYLGNFSLKDVLRFKKEWEEYEKKKKSYPPKKEELEKVLKPNQVISIQPFFTFIHTYGNAFKGVKIPKKIRNFCQQKLEYSYSGNAYIQGQKPRDIFVPEGLKRLECHYPEKSKIEISLTEYNFREEEYKIVESLTFNNCHQGFLMSVKLLESYIKGSYTNSLIAAEEVAERPFRPFLYHEN